MGLARRDEDDRGSRFRHDHVQRQAAPVFGRREQVVAVALVVGH
jgi:hypothetical protein